LGLGRSQLLLRSDEVGRSAAGIGDVIVQLLARGELPLDKRLGALQLARRVRRIGLGNADLGGACSTLAWTTACCALACARLPAAAVRFAIA